MITPRELLEAAYAKGMKNRPGTIATESVELLQVVIRSMRGLYAVAARVNPYFFGDTETGVAHNGTGWPRPAAAESVTRIEGEGAGNVASGTEVVVVPFEDRGAESGMPAVFSFGQVYRPAGNDPDPDATDTLAFYFSKRPDDPADLDSAVDSLWTEQFNELLILEVALYLALKEGASRSDEASTLAQERDQWAQRYVAFLEHETPFIRRRYGHVQRFTTQSLVPLGSLLAGGSANIGGGGS